MSDIDDLLLREYDEPIDCPSCGEPMFHGTHCYGCGYDLEAPLLGEK